MRLSLRAAQQEPARLPRVCFSVRVFRSRILIHSFNVRVDYTPTEKDQVAVRYVHDRGFLTPDFGNNASLVGFDSQQGGFS